MEEEVKVVGFWVSLFVHRVRWALTLKGISYQYIEEDIFNRTSLLKQLNPVYGKVPVLLHNGNPLPESTIILEYIDQVWNHNPPLLPQHPYHRAQHRFWAKFIDDKIMPSAYFITILQGEMKEKAMKALCEGLEKIEERLKEGNSKFFGGETLGYLDLVLGFVACILPAWEEVGSVKVVESGKFPSLSSWIDDFLNHPVVKAEYLPPMSEMVPFYKKRQEQWLSDPAAVDKLASRLLDI